MPRIYHAFRESLVWTVWYPQIHTN